MKLIVSSAIVLLLIACGRRTVEPENVYVAPLYDGIYHFPTLDSIARLDFIERNRAELHAFMTVVSGEPLNADLLESWAESRAVEVFTPLVDSVFRHVSPSEDALGHILAAAVGEGLPLPSRRYAEVVYGRPESILFVDSVMLIALNHYLGADFEGYSHLPLYMRLTKKPAMIPYDIAEAIVATSYPFERTSETTVLSRLLYDGALVHAKLTLVENPDEAIALGYTPEQFKWLEQNEKNLWTALVSKGLLFDTSESVASRLVEPAPATSELLAGTPGRAGRYIGYKMVEYYLENHSDVNLSFLLSPRFYADDAVLNEISYNP